MCRRICINQAQALVSRDGKSELRESLSDSCKIIKRYIYTPNYFDRTYNQVPTVIVRESFVLVMCGLFLAKLSKGTTKNRGGSFESMTISMTFRSQALANISSWLE